MENIGAKLVRQAAAKTNDLAGDGTTTSVVLAQGLITEGVKVCLKKIFTHSDSPQILFLFARSSYPCIVVSY